MNGTNKHGLHINEPRWFALYVRYKREKLVYERLQDKGIYAYLPLQKITRRYTRKVKKLEIPLISCYLFTRITKKEYLPVLKTDDVLHFVRISKQMIAIPEQEIQLLKRVIGGGMDISADPISYQKGDKVEIIGGNLTGIKGTLVDRGNKKDFLVELQHTGYALRMQIDQSLLRKIGITSNT